MRTAAVLFFAVFLFVQTGTAIAQGDSAARQKADSTRTADSLQNVLLQQQTQRLQELREARAQDSIKKAELERQINSLQTTDNLKKQELQQQLDAIKSRDSARLSQQKQRIDSLRAFITGFPVVPFQLDTVFYVYSRLGSFSPKDRADAIAERINKLTDDYFFDTDSIHLDTTEQTIDIVSGDQIIMSVSDNDALWMNTSKEQLATNIRNEIARSINDYKRATSWQTILKEIALALLVIGVVFAIIYYAGKLFRWSRFKIISQKGKRIKGFKIGNYELFDANQQVGVLLLLNTIIKWLFILITIYLALPTLFGIFPWTKDFAETLLSYFLDPLTRILGSVWRYLPKLFTIIVIIIIFRYVLKGLSFLKSEVEKEELKIQGFYPDWANPTFQILRILLLAFMLIIIYPYLPGSESAVFRGVSVFVGVLFTFGSAGSLSNIIAGLVLTYMRAFKIGDRVKIGDVTGDIIEKSMLVTRIRTIKNEIISIPNATVMNSHTTNYSSDAPEKGLIIYTTVTIGYDVPWRTVHKLLIDAALATNMIEKTHQPFVLQTSLDDFYVSYQLNAYTKEPNKQSVIYSELHQHIQDKFNEAGVEIMSPHYKALRDGNTTAIPPEHLPKDYTPPSFNIKQERKDNAG